MDDGDRDTEHGNGGGGDPALDLDAVFEDAPCGFLIVSSDWRVRRVNRTFGLWTGHDPAALTGRPFTDLLDIAGKIYVGTHFSPLLRLQGHFDEVALNVVASDGGKLPVLVNAREQRDADGRQTGVTVSVFNATDRRRYEAELLEARNALREVNETLEARIKAAVAERMAMERELDHARRMETIGNLSAGVAHDFNNLLQVIGGNLSLLGKHVATEQGRMRVRNAQGGVERGARLASQLLAFGRREALRPEVVGIGALVQRLADTLLGAVGRDIDIAVQEAGAAPGETTVHVDAALLENAILNLVINARDAIRDAAPGTCKARSPSIAITTGRVALDARRDGTATGSVPAGDWVRIGIADTGPGMAPDVAARIFDPFFTTKEAGKGTGLGLSMVYGFVGQSGGHVTVDSRPSEGATVSLWLPHDARAPDADRDGAPAAASSGGRARILLVEDDPDVLAITRDVLEEAGHLVLVAKDGPSAFAVVTSGETLDLVLADIVMPGSVRGEELGRLIEAHDPGLPVAFLTGYSDAATETEAGGTRRTLSKPFTVETLLRLVDELRRRDDAAGGRARPATVSPTASVTLPDGAPSAAPIAPEPDRTTVAARHILLVEDEVLIRMDTAEMLRDLGHDVVDVGSAEEAMAAVERADRTGGADRGTGFDVLITDVNLDGMSGTELAERLLKEDPRLRVVFATGDSGPPGPSSTASYLRKPYGVEQLREVLAD